MDQRAQQKAAAPIASQSPGGNVSPVRERPVSAQPAAPLVTELVAAGHPFSFAFWFAFALAPARPLASPGGPLASPELTDGPYHGCLVGYGYALGVGTT